MRICLIIVMNKTMEDISIIDTNIENIALYGTCGYKNIRKPGLPEKMNWLRDRFPEGLRIKTLYSEKDGTQGMIEYIPGKYCWRPVDAEDYMFIHCIFVGFKKAYKNNGYASQLIAECEIDAKRSKLKGVAVITRKGSFMVGKELFIKNGYQLADSARPDFELLIKKTNAKSPDPKFRNNPHQYQKGLTIIRSDQCPYTIKNVNEICETAEKEFSLPVNLVNLKSYKEAQRSPCPFGSFCLIYNGDIVSYHPISKGRFVNIMNKLNA
jgi:YoaP-like